MLPRHGPQAATIKIQDYLLPLLYPAEWIESLPNICRESFEISSGCIALAHMTIPEPITVARGIECVDGLVWVLRSPLEVVIAQLDHKIPKQ